jgi:hypothetical protein
VLGICPDARQNLQPAPFRQIEIQDEQIRKLLGHTVFLDAPYRFLAIHHYLQFGVDVVSCYRFLNQVNVGSVVFNQEDLQLPGIGGLMPGP